MLLSTILLSLFVVYIQYHSSLAALNGLEAHLRSITPGPPGTQGPYVFAHFDCIQSTLTCKAPIIPTDYKSHLPSSS